MLSTIQVKLLHECRLYYSVYAGAGKVLTSTIKLWNFVGPIQSLLCLTMH